MIDTNALAQRRLAVFALASVMAFLLGSLLVAPFFRTRGNAVPATHDMDDHLATLEDFDQGLRAGSFYPRWQSGFDWGYGLPRLNYYQPGLYYLAEPAYLALHDSTEALLVVCVLAMAGSGLAFFWFARLFYSPIPSAVGALLYMAAPYHLIDLYIRGAFPEFTNFVFAPLIFGSAYLACRFGRPRHIAGLGLCIGLSIFTHLSTAYLEMIALAFYVLAFAAVERNWRIAARAAAGCALALLGTAVYWLPAAWEAGLVDQYFATAASYQASYLPYFRPYDDVGRMLSQSLFIEAALLLAAMVLLGATGSPLPKTSGGKGKRRKEAPSPNIDRDAGLDAATRLQTRLLLATGIFSIFMVMGFLEFALGWIPKIVEVVQFAWRGLLPVSLFAAAAVAAVLHRLNERRLDARWLGSPAWRWGYRGGVALLILGHLLAGGVIARYAFDQPNLRRRPFFADGIFYPHGATPPYQLPNSPKAMLTSGRGQAKVVRWDWFFREVDVTAEQAAILRLRTYNFPGWTSRLDGHPAATRSDIGSDIESDLDGAQTVAVPAGHHRIEVRFGSTPVRTAGAAISALGVFLLLGLLVADYSKRK